MSGKRSDYLRVVPSEEERKETPLLDQLSERAIYRLKVVERTPGSSYEIHHAIRDTILGLEDDPGETLMQLTKNLPYSPQTAVSMMGELEIGETDTWNNVYQNIIAIVLGHHIMILSQTQPELDQLIVSRQK